MLNNVRFGGSNTVPFSDLYASTHSQAKVRSNERIL